MFVSWPEVAVDDIKSPKPGALAMGPFGSNIKTDNFVPQGVPIIRGGNLGGGRFKDEDFVYLTPEKADELRSANAFPGDIVFTHRGTLGQVGIIPKKARYPRYVVSQSQMKLSCDASKAHPLFIFYFFRSNLGQHALLANTSTTGVPAISSPLTSLRTIRLLLPPLPEQQAIAHILGTLDDKIELNRRMNETLEAMARALFQSWFVDFDPVRAKAAGRQPEGLDAATAALFPDSFDDSLLGKIPKDWAIKSFDQLVEIWSGGTPKTSIAEYWNGDIPWFRVTDVPLNSDIFVLDTERYISQAGVDHSATKILSVGTTIISARGTVGKLAMVGKPMAMNQTCYGLKLKNDG